MDESFRQPDDSELEALCDAKRIAGAMRDFDAATADVHHHCRRRGNIDAVNRCEMDQPGFLGPRDDLRLNARLTFDSRQEFAAVFRLPYRAGRGCEDLFALMRLGEPAK